MNLIHCKTRKDMNAMKKRFLCMLIALAIVTTFFNYGSVLAREYDFNDVPDSHWAYNTIMRLSNDNIIDGFEDNTFVPEGEVTREQFIKLLTCATQEIDDESSVIDISDIDGLWSYTYISNAQKQSIINESDYPDGLFCPQELMNRAVAAKWIYNSLRISISDDTTLHFNDITDDSTQKFVSVLSSVGIISGYEDGGFHPDSTLTRAEAATIIEKIMDYLETWYVSDEPRNIIEYSQKATVLDGDDSVNVIKENNSEYCEFSNVDNNILGQKAGDVVIVPACEEAPSGLAVKIKEIIVSDNTVKIIKDDNILLSEIADKIDFNQITELTADDIIETNLQKGVTITKGDSYALLENTNINFENLTASADKNALFELKTGNNENGKFKISLDSGLELPYGLTVGGDIVVNEISLHPSINYDSKRDGEIPNFNFEINTDISPDIKISCKKALDDIKLAEIPFEVPIEPFTISGGIEFKLGAEGEVSATVHYNVTTSDSFQYKPLRDIAPTYKNHKCTASMIDQPTMEAKVSLTPKADLYISFNLFEEEVFSLAPTIEAGVEISAILAQPHSCDICLDIELQPYVEFDIVPGAFTKQWKWVLYRGEFSKLIYHLSHNNDEWEFAQGRCPYLDTLKQEYFYKELNIKFCLPKSSNINKSNYSKYNSLYITVNDIPNFYIRFSEIEKGDMCQLFRGGTMAVQTSKDMINYTERNMKEASGTDDEGLIDDYYIYDDYVGEKNNIKTYILYSETHDEAGLNRSNNRYHIVYHYCFEAYNKIISVQFGNYEYEKKDAFSGDMLSYMNAIMDSLQLVIPQNYNKSVVDGANFLTDSEQKELIGNINNIVKKYNIDIVVITENKMSGPDAQSTADDIYDKNEYGIGKNKDGILLYISKNPRKYHYTTTGRGITIFNEQQLQYIDSQVLPLLQNDNYYQAINTYVKIVKEIIEHSPN